MADCNLPVHKSEGRQPAAKRLGLLQRGLSISRAIRTFVDAAAGLVALIFAAPAFAQAPPLPPYVACPEDNPPLIQIPELVSQNGKLRGTILLSNGMQRLYLGDTSPDGKTRWCLPQNVRQFRGIRAEAATYRGEPPQGYPSVVPTPPLQYLDPVPGPTLRARLGDIVQLTFLNQINPSVGWRSIDRGEGAEGCDHNRDPDGNVLYPALDVFPNCFHGSSTGNIHFHGTHTNPGSTGDNIFIEVRPSLRDNDQPIVTETSVKKSFDEFFFNCETELNKSVLSQWPRTWADLPRTYTRRQETLLKRYDSNPRITRKLWPVDEAQRKAGEWPQYYIGAFPYCFRLPEYTDTKWPPDEPAHPPSHTGVARDELRPLLMGQVPGIHWYHAHKHGSTAINVANGMTGAFIIEGPYDDALNTYYGEASADPRTWTQSQPVMVINQLGTVPGLFTGASGRLPLSVNGGFQPTVKMRPGEVQMWRIVNTSSRSGVYFDGIYPEPRPAVPSDGSTPPWPRAPFKWKQLAQDGVQFTADRYDASDNSNFVMAPGNRVDLLVQAPDNATGGPQLYSVQIQDVVARSGPFGTQPSSVNSLTTLLMVHVESGTTVTGNQSSFIPKDQLATFPLFLADIKPEEVKATKKIKFATTVPTTTPPGVQAPFGMHMIDGKPFDGNVGQIVLLNTVEEWKIENATVAPAPIDHPFHIHINPFQVVEVFDPNAKLVDDKGQPLRDKDDRPAVDRDGNPLDKYVLDEPAFADLQCQLKRDDPNTWRDCHNVERQDRVWWDVFPIPSGRQEADVVIPGYFRMRSRFVDYTGQYVIHCHILAHEDRGMMTVVQVAPFRTPYSHQ